MTTLLSLKTDMFQQLQLLSSEWYKTKWKQIVMYNSDDRSCNHWNMSVFKLKSVVLFVKFIIHFLLLPSFGNI